MDATNEMEQSNTFIVKYRQQYYNLSKFMHKHPGGISTLKGLNEADMTARFMKAPPHSDAAMYLMREYKVGPAEYENHKKTKGQRQSKATENGVELLQHAKEPEDSNNNHTDESMEVTKKFNIFLIR